MGDRTFVTLTVPMECKPQVLQLCKDYSSPSEREDVGNLAIMYFEEVNYGELPFLDQLQDHGIPFDSEWEDGGSYKAGGAYLRFTPEGKPDFKEIYDNCRNPDLGTLLQLIDVPDELRKNILAFKESVLVMDWDHQVEYGKIYRVKRLIQLEQ
jgi:hypothetical protein